MSIESLKNSLKKLSGLLSANAEFIGRMAIAVLITQILFALLAGYFRLMLHADGAKFSYDLFTGSPWELHWREFGARYSAYLLTILPVDWLHQRCHFDNSQLVALYSLDFYLLPCIHFLIIIGLVWRAQRHLLFFPIAQYLFSLSMGYGFPSEMFVATGFFWICMLCIARNPMSLPLLMLSLLGLMFAHELAMPGAFIVLFFFILVNKQRASHLSASAWVFYGFFMLSFLLWLAVKYHYAINGGGGGSNNMASVFDPRIILNNHIAFVLGFTLAVIYWLYRKNYRFTKQGEILWALFFLVFTLIAGHWLKFAVGKYASARTLMGLEIVAFGGLFIYTYLHSALAQVANAADLSSLLRVSLMSLLAVNIAANSCFLADWQTTRSAFARVVNENSSGKTVIMDYDSAMPLFHDEELRATQRIHFISAWPYRSLMLVKNYQAANIIVDPTEIKALCEIRLSTAQPSPVPLELTDKITHYACSNKAPETKALSLKAKNRDWLHAEKNPVNGLPQP